MKKPQYTVNGSFMDWERSSKFNKGHVEIWGAVNKSSNTSDRELADHRNKPEPGH